MKIAKRIVTALLAVAMLASVMVLASCSLLSGGVEKRLEKLIDADSFTIERTSTDENDGEKSTTERIIKVDTKNLVVYDYYKSDSVKEEEYLYYDKDEEEYYYYRYYKNGDSKATETKEELEVGEFIEKFSSYAGYNADMAGVLASLDLWEKDGGEYTLVDNGEESKDTTVLKIEDGNLVKEYSTKYEGDYYSYTSKGTYTYSDINKTKIEIPEDVLEMDAD